MATAFLVQPRDTMAPLLRDTAHRPWPLPAKPWVMTQTWQQLLFAHCPVDVAWLRRFVPFRFEIEQFQGQAWIGVVPFLMKDVRFRGLPGIPGATAFPELNVRTYVRVDDKPGVYFFSLDAASALAVWGARQIGLPYHRAEMDVRQDGRDTRYYSRRRGARAVFSASYRPSGAPFRPMRGTLEYFLTERYCLYGQNRSGRPYRLDIHHRPWSLHPATVDVQSNTMISAAGLPPCTTLSRYRYHFASQQSVVVWAPTYLT
jgi:uncharacterized protein